MLDARALGDPGFLGEVHIDVASLSLEPNSPPVNLWLPLKVWHAKSKHMSSNLDPSHVADATNSLSEPWGLTCLTLVQTLQGSRLGAIHVQLALLLKPDAVKPLLARSACAGKPRDPPGAPADSIIGRPAVHVLLSRKVQAVFWLRIRVGIP